jgi:autotransporter-associated beta strand protein
MKALPSKQIAPRLRLLVLASITSLTSGLLQAEIITKLDTGIDLAADSSWDGAAPTAADVALWSSNSLGAGLALQSTVYWDGISVADALTDIDLSGAGILGLGASGIDMSASLVNLSIATPILLDANQAWNVSPGKTLLVSGAIYGTWNLELDSSGTVALSGNNPMTGLTTVNAGTLVISGQLHYNEGWLHLNALTINPNATVVVSSGDAENFLGQCNFDATYNTINGGVLQFDTAAGTAEGIDRAFTIGPNSGAIQVLNSNATLTFNYFSAQMQFSIAAPANLILTGDGNGIMNKSIGGDGGLIKCGTGSWTLNQANTYSGPTIISNGLLVVNGSLGSGAVTVESGATLSGSGTIAGSATFLPGAQIQFTLGATMAYGGALTLNDNPVHLVLNTCLPPGNYPLATYNAYGSTGSFHRTPVIDSGALTSGCTATVNTDSGHVTLSVRPTPAPHLAIISISGDPFLAVGADFSVTVQAEDTNNNALTMTADTNVVLSLSSGNGSLGGNLSGTILAGSNSTIISGVTYSLAESNVVITATNPGGTLLPGDSDSFTVNPGPTITLTSSGDWNARPGTVLPTFILTVLDAYGNPVAGAGVTFSIATIPNGATGQSLSVTNAVTGTDGTACCTLTLGDKLGTYIVTANLDGLNVTPAIITATATNSGWAQVWSDEFNYSGLPDSNKWGYENGFVRNQESQYYTTNRLENACVTNGMLIITARKEAYFLPGQLTNIADYTSASLITQDKENWTYGRIEMRAQLPAPISGVWPAFWMLGTNITTVGWPACGEIDILEYIGRNPYFIHANAFYGVDGVAIGSDLWYSTPTPPFDGFHTYAIDWSAQQIDFLYDGSVYFSYPVNYAGSGPDNPFRNPQYLILNFALGGDFGGPIWDPGLPQQYTIDYVRVYQLIPAWTGADSDTLWSTVGNWTNALPPTTGSSVVFAGQTSLMSCVDGSYSLADISFYETAGSNVLGATNGGMLTLAQGGISNYSTNEQTFNVPITLAANQTFDTDSGDLVICGAISGNGFGLNKTGIHTLTLSGSNTYSGPTTIAAGTLALGPGGALATSGFNIAAGGALDLSALGDDIIPSNVWLSASGAGLIVSASAAVLNGGVTNTIRVDSNAIHLLYDGADPALCISQGVLCLNGNAFTIDTSNGNALSPGAYPIIWQASGNILSGNAFPSVAGTAIATGQAGNIVVSNNFVNLVITPAPAITNWPVVINAPVVRDDGTIQLTFSGGNASLAYRIEANDDLTTTNWVTLCTNVLGTNGLSSAIDVTATNNQRFYRVVTP